MKLLCCIALLICPLLFSAQNQYDFPVDNINALIQNGTCIVNHSEFDIGSISDVFDGNTSSLARSANINPLVITLTFPFPVSFSGSEVFHSYGDGWWSLEVADTEDDLLSQSGTYEQLFPMSALMDAVPQIKTFDLQSKRIIRMTVRRTSGDDYVHLNEWKLINAFASVELTSICIEPSEVWLLPDSEFEVSATGRDAQGLSYSLQTDINWNILNTDICSIAPENGKAVVNAGDTGTTWLTATWKGLEKHIPVSVVNQFKPMTSATRPVNVVLVIIDPPIEAEEGLRFHQRFGWDDPINLTNALRDSMNSAGAGAVSYQIVDIYDEAILYTDFQGTIITVDSMYRMFLEPGWTTFHQLEQIGGSIQFDYNGLLTAHNFCSQSDSGQIDEIWVYSMPFTGMYESRLTGEGAFWYNSPPLSGNPCIGQLPIMGFNYERGVAEAMHSFGHRVESAMAHTFGRWDYGASEKNDWEKFASYDEAVPGQAHCGNVHFPPNGISDYDYENQSFVSSQAGNWAYYPFLFQFEKTFNCMEWGCSHLGYMSWWFHHLPHFTCRNKDGILNNWWAYIVDYQEGKLLETETSACICKYVEDMTSTLSAIERTKIEIYPNPSQGFVTLDLREVQHEELTLEIYNPYGVKVKRVFIKGYELEMLDLQDLPPAIYSVLIYDGTGTMKSQGTMIIISH